MWRSRSWSRVAVLLAGGVLAGCSSGQTGPPPSTKSVLSKLKASDLPIGKVDNYTASSDPNKLLGRPDQYVGKANFRDRRLKDDTLPGIDTTEGGSVEVFADEDTAKTREEYVKAIGETPAFAEYGYREGRVLLRLGNELTPNQAAKYEDALRKAGG
jgi:hypothetical protein